MRPRLEWTVLAAVVVPVAATGCGGAQPTAVALPDAAHAIGVAPDFAGTLWVTTGSRPWRSQDGGTSWQPVRGKGGGLGIAFTEIGGEVVGAEGGQRGDYGGKGLLAPRRTPTTFVSIATPYHRTDRLYAVDLFGHPWLSVDAGAHWHRLRAARLPSTALAVGAVRGDVLEPDIVYMACGDDGLWRSLDDGATFTHMPAPATATAIATTTDDQRRILVAGRDAVYLSTDFGRTFLPVLHRTVDAVAFDPRNRRLAYAAVGRTLLRSVDGGETWPAS
ncbi:MAG TPA: hypothetical protein VGC71_04585 [Gaiellales bacterium]|jgi:hypothetical protein